jgi:hypothetical protein
MKRPAQRPRLSFGWQAGAFLLLYAPERRSTLATRLGDTWQAEAMCEHTAHHAANQAQVRLLEDDLRAKGLRQGECCAARPEQVLKPKPQQGQAERCAGHTSK